MQSHIWQTASSYMTKYLCISSYIRKPFLIYDFAPDPIWISLNIRNSFFYFFFSVGIISFADGNQTLFCTLPIFLKINYLWLRFIFYIDFPTIIARSWQQHCQSLTSNSSPLSAFSPTAWLRDSPTLTMNLMNVFFIGTNVFKDNFAIISSICT